MVRGSSLSGSGVGTRVQLVPSGEGHTAGQLLDLLDVLVGNRAADAGDDVAVAVLVGNDGVHVALDDHHAVGAADGVAREVEAVEGGAFVEEGQLLFSISRKFHEQEVQGAEANLKNAIAE